MYSYAALESAVAGRLFSRPRLCLLAISKEMHIERHTIEAALRSTRGLTFRRFQQVVTLEKTRELLRVDPTVSIKEVAYALGYGSPRAFARFVRAATALSPRELRDRIHSDVSLQK